MILDTVRRWIISLASVGVIGAAALSITLSPKMKRVVSLACAFLASAVMLSPISGLRGADITEYGLAAEIQNVPGALTEKNRELRADIIARESEAYIVNKAREYGTEVTAKVELGENDAPYSCELLSDSGAAVRFVVSEMIENDLGIPPERQYWG